MSSSTLNFNLVSEVYDIVKSLIDLIMDIRRKKNAIMCDSIDKKIQMNTQFR
jgi:hypothetical protein